VRDHRSFACRFYWRRRKSPLIEPIQERIISSQSEALERRTQIRFSLRAPVHFLWKNRDGVVQHGDGFTRDISSRAAYVYTESQPPTDAEIDIDIVLAWLSEEHSSLHMSGKAKVIRVEATTTDEHSGAFVAGAESFTLHQRAANPQE
jgi:hypothetical protein